MEAPRGEPLQPAVLSVAGPPNWVPLDQFAAAASGRILASDFMWMGAVQLANGTRIEEYKHHMTRRYLRLDDHAHAWTPTSRTRYEPLESPQHAIDLALDITAEESPLASMMPPSVPLEATLDVGLA